MYNFWSVTSSLLFVLAMTACSSGGNSDDTGSGNEQDNGADTGDRVESCDAQSCKPLPSGIYESAGINDPVGNISDSAAVVGVLVRHNWNECDDEDADADNIDCLIDAISADLDAAQAKGVMVNLIVMDGHSAPDFVKQRCTVFDYDKQGSPAQMCLPWDENYLADKLALITALGQFDSHPALALMYFTGACSSNGAEGACSVDETEYTAAGYTPERLAESYRTIMDMYRTAFPTTPLAFEVHEIFASADLWQNLWDHVSDGGRVGVASWWCSERLTLSGSNTVGVWPIVQAAASETFSVCQTVGNFTLQAWRFTDVALGLDYGQADESTDEQILNAFNDTINWAQGWEIHANQTEMIVPYSVIEVWTKDVDNPDFQNRLLQF